MEIVIAIVGALGLMAFGFFYFRGDSKKAKLGETDRTQVMPASMQPKKLQPPN